MKKAMLLMIVTGWSAFICLLLADNPQLDSVIHALYYALIPLTVFAAHIFTRKESKA